MRISSDFKDYYDVGQSFGQDQTLVYKRYSKEVTVEETEYPFPSFFSRNGNGDIHVEDYMIGFCGKLYGALEINTQSTFNCGYGVKDYRNNRKFCFNMKDVDAYIEDKFEEDKVEAYQATTTGRWIKEWRTISRFDFVKYFEQREEGRDCYKAYFEKNNCPIFIAHRGRWFRDKPTITYNGCLKHFGFYRVFDPYQAYQELSMYLGNQAEPRKPIPHISDETMLEIKGFDPRYSFRKDKQNRC